MVSHFVKFCWDTKYCIFLSKFGIKSIVYCDYAVILLIFVQLLLAFGFVCNILKIFAFHA